MTEFKLMELMSGIDEQLLLRANAPVPVYRRPKIRVVLLAAAIALLLAATMLLSPLAVAFSYMSAHPEIEGGLIYAVDAMLKDEDHFINNVLPGGVRNTLGAVFSALTGSGEPGEDQTQIGSESETESATEIETVTETETETETQTGTETETETEIQTEPEFVIPPESQGLELALTPNQDGYRVMGIGSCKDVHLVIPCEYNGLPVTEIYWNLYSGDHAFEQNTQIESVIIPSSIRKIGEYAFCECSSLKSVVILAGDTPVEIGYGSFGECAALEEFIIPDNVTRFSDPFLLSSTNIGTKKVFPKTTEYDNAYYLGNEQNPYMVLVQMKDATANTCQVHPDTKIIGGGAFYGSSITEIVIPEGVMTIDDNAFAQASALATFSFPDSLRFVGKQAFTNCAAVTTKSKASYVGDAENPYLILFESEFLDDVIHPDTCYVADYAYFDSRYVNNKGSKSLTIPEKMRYIGKYAFQSKRGDPDTIGSLTVYGDNLHIEERAFPQILHLRSIFIGKGVSYIAPTAFHGDLQRLDSITVEEGNPYYAAPDDCLIEIATGTLLRACTSSVFPADGSIKHIAEGAFWGRRSSDTVNDPLDNLTKVLPDGIQSIGSWAFYESSYEQFNLPASVTQLGDYALYDMKNIIYNGTIAQFRALNQKAFGPALKTVQCSDGTLSFQEESTQ